VPFYLPPLPHGFLVLGVGRWSTPHRFGGQALRCVSLLVLLCRYTSAQHRTPVFSIPTLTPDFHVSGDVGKSQSLLLLGSPPTGPCRSFVPIPSIRALPVRPTFPPQIFFLSPLPTTCGPSPTAPICKLPQFSSSPTPQITLFSLLVLLGLYAVRLRNPEHGSVATPLILTMRFDCFRHSDPLSRYRLISFAPAPFSVLHTRLKPGNHSLAPSLVFHLPV